MGLLPRRSTRKKKRIPRLFPLPWLPRQELGGCFFCLPRLLGEPACLAWPDAGNSLLDSAVGSMAWIRWALLAGACLSWCPALEASEKGSHRTVTYVLRPEQTGAPSRRRQSGWQPLPPRTFNVELLNTRYSSSSSSSSRRNSGGNSRTTATTTTLERTRRMSKAGGPSMQLRLGPTVQLQHKPAAAAAFGKTGKLVARTKLQQRQSNGTTGAQGHPKPHLQG